MLAVLTLVGQPTPETPSTTALVYGLDDLPGALRALPGRLTHDEIWAIAGHLQQLLGGARSPEQATTAALATATGPPGRSSTPSRRPRAARAIPAARRGRAPARRRRSARLGLTLGKLALILLLGFVVVPRVLPALAQSIGERMSDQITRSISPPTPTPATSSAPPRAGRSAG